MTEHLAPAISKQSKGLSQMTIQASYDNVALSVILMAACSHMQYSNQTHLPQHLLVYMRCEQRCLIYGFEVVVMQKKITVNSPQVIAVHSSFQSIVFLSSCASMRQSPLAMKAAASSVALMLQQMSTVEKKRRL